MVGIRAPVKAEKTKWKMLVLITDFRFILVIFAVIDEFERIYHEPEIVVRVCSHNSNKNHPYEENPFSPRPSQSREICRIDST